MVNAHLAVVPQQREGKQGHHRSQPEQQIQHKGQRRQADAPAQGAHPVVEQTQRRPQQKPLAEDQPLARDIDVHRSAQQPGQEPAPASSGVVLVTDGVDVALHL